MLMSLTKYGLKGLSISILCIFHNEIVVAKVVYHIFKFY